MRTSRLLALLFTGAVAVNYSGEIRDTVNRILGPHASSVTVAIDDIYQNRSVYLDKAGRLVNNSGNNFQQGVDDFVNVAREFNPSAGGHVDCSRMFQQMDLNTLLYHIRNNDL